MRVYRHFAANEEHLELFPFRRELSMQAYLIENPKLLGLDDGCFSGSNVEIVNEELHLKVGRKSKDTDGRIDILARYSDSDGYLAVVELKLGMLDFSHLEQLEDYLSEKRHISEALGEAEVADHKWLGVLVGALIHPELAAKISSGYVTKDGIQIAALTLQRFRSASGSVFVTTDVFHNLKSAQRDYKKYVFEGREYGKGRLVLAAIKQFVEKNPDFGFADLERIFPRHIQGAIGVFSSAEEANKIFTSTGRKRHFIEANEVVQLRDSSIAVCSQWGSGNIKNFLEKMSELKMSVKEG
jgi:hypothetical protein